MAADGELFSVTSGKGKNKSTQVYIRNVEQEQKLFQKLASDTLKHEEEVNKQRVKQIEATQKKIQAAQAAGRAAEVSDLEKQLSEMLSLKEQHEAEVQSIKQKSQQLAEKFEINRVKNMSLLERKAYQAALQERRRALQQEWGELQQEGEELKKILSDKSIPKEQKEKLKADYEDRRSSVEKQLAATSQASTTVVGKELNGVATAAEKLAKSFGILDRATKKEHKTLQEDLKAKKAAAEAARKKSEQYEQEKRGTKGWRSATSEKYRSEAEAAEAAAANAEEELKKFEKESGISEQQSKRDKQMHDAVNKLSQSINAAFEKSWKSLYESRGKMEGRLQGLRGDYSNAIWKEAVSTVTENIGINPVLTQTAVIKQMEKLVDSGVAYNLELRAYLAEATESIAATFNAFDANLLRLIRIQQQDSTAARLGMEAALTKFFNENFEDTSYLANNIADTVSGALLDASAILTNEQAVEFEYIVQKWLGSLYSMGLSQELVSRLATGLNYLGSGNLSKLSQDTGLQALFGIVSPKITGGKSFTDMLNTGLTSEATNSLLEEIVIYLADIAENQSTNVTKSAYADLFGMSITDLNVFHSLSQDMASVKDLSQTYQSLVNETSSQLSQLNQRISITKQIDNFLDNANTSAAEAYVDNPAMYLIWKALSMVEGIGIKIPGIQAAGFGWASELDIPQLIKSGMAAGGLLSSLLSGVNFGLGAPSIDLADWNASTHTSRGSTLRKATLKNPVSSGLSYSQMIGTYSNEFDTMKDVALAQAEKDAKDANSSAEEQADEAQNTQETIKDSLTDGNVTAVQLLKDIKTLLDPTRVFYTAIAGTLTSTAASQLISLSAQLSTTAVASNTDIRDDKFSLDRSDINFISEGRILTDSEQTMWTDIISRAISQALTNGGLITNAVTGLFTPGTSIL